MHVMFCNSHTVSIIQSKALLLSQEHTYNKPVLHASLGAENVLVKAALTHKLLILLLRLLLYYFC